MRRSVLSAKADDAEPLKPGKVWDEHSILLLEGGEPLPDKLVSEIQEEVKKVRTLAPCTGPSCCPLTHTSASPTASYTLMQRPLLGRICVLLEFESAFHGYHGLVRHEVTVTVPHPDGISMVDSSVRL